MDKVLLDNLNVFLKEELFKELILDKLERCKSEEDKIIYCEKLLKNGNNLMLLLSQTKMLKLNFPYNLLNNIEKRKIQKAIDYNDRRLKGLIKFKKTKKKKKNTSSEDWKTKNSIRSISTPMYS